MAKRWQDDKDFTEFLDAMRYTGNLSDGLYLYMWEAWRHAKGDTSMLPKPRAVEEGGSQTKRVARADVYLDEMIGAARDRVMSAIALKCRCTYEAGDSPCPVHGLEDEEGRV
jgi:hypothetical protein